MYSLFGFKKNLSAPIDCRDLLSILSVNVSLQQWTDRAKADKRTKKNDAVRMSNVRLTGRST